ncbi:acyltransferase-domain-containing protein [Zopfochytrium polystomum]|nr:acyltransferase-domain-containing protein [Zopfochytrium polystomum]
MDAAAAGSHPPVPSAASASSVASPSSSSPPSGGDPSSSKSTTPSKKDTPEFYIRAVLFTLFIYISSLGIVVLQIPSLLLFYFHSHHVYRSYIRLTEQIFGSVAVTVTELFCPGTALVLTGDYDKLSGKEKAVLFANHQIYPDWLYLWALAWYSGAHGEVKILLMEYLRLLPVLGQGMWFFELIFMKQKADVDKLRITKYLTRACHPRNPLWLYIFPEGTLNTPGNVAKSKAHAAKEGIADHPKHVILPRATGLHHCLLILKGHNALDSVFDLTVGYSGLNATDIPYYSYLVEDVYFRKKYPRRIHIHIEKIPIPTVPGLESASAGFASGRVGIDAANEAEKKAFTHWLRHRYTLKDARLATFFDKGSMVLDKEEEARLAAAHGGMTKRIVRLEAELYDWLRVGGAWYAVWVLVPLYWRILMFVPRLLIFGF